MNRSLNKVVIKFKTEVVVVIQPPLSQLFVTIDDIKECDCHRNQNLRCS